MAKRRAQDTLLYEAPSKRCFRSLCTADMKMENTAPTGDESRPPLLALLGSRCRKRPHCFEELEKQEGASAALCPSTTNCDTRKHAAHVLTVQTSGSFQDPRSSAGTTKRPREDCTGPGTVIRKVNNKADAYLNTDDCTYNSFQYWRVPLPELDLSLLEDAGDHSPTKKSKVKDSDAMET